MAAGSSARLVKHLGRRSLACATQSTPRPVITSLRTLSSSASPIALLTTAAPLPSTLQQRRFRHDAARPADFSSESTSANGPAPASIPPPLRGIRVVDLTRVLAGPYCTMLLADLGADVVKIEHPKGGDDTRAWGPPYAEPSPDASLPPVPKGKEAYWSSLPKESAYFLSVNRSKRSITVDLKSAEGRAIVRKLVEQADVVVENYLPGKLAAMGLGYEQMKEWKKDIIYASITGYGQTGPYGNSAGYDVIIAADAGLFHM